VLDPSLVWLRRDLRLHDHEPLTRALARGGGTVIVFCFDPRELATTFLGGFPRTGVHRARFLLASVAALRAAITACVISVPPSSVISSTGEIGHLRAPNERLN
jgi:deoxyribodipyrimidine photolyase